MKYKTKDWLFEERNKVDEPLARLIKKKRGSKWGLRKERRVTTDTIEIQIILKDYEVNYTPTKWKTEKKLTNSYKCTIIHNWTRKKQITWTDQLSVINLNQ